MSIVLDGTAGITTPALDSVARFASADMPLGSVLQVVQGSTSTPATSSSTTFADTGLSATITPTSATSNILILVAQNGCGKNTNNVQLRLRLLREATSIVDIERNGGFSGNSDANFIGSCSVNFLDSPATTSATTYKTQFSCGSASASVLVQSDSGGIGSTSTITLMEIAA